MIEPIAEEFVKRIMSKNDIKNIFDIISKSKDGYAYIKIEDISDKFDIKDSRYIRYIMGYYLIPYGLIVEYREDIDSLTIRRATDDELFAITGILISDREKKENAIEPLIRHEDILEQTTITDIIKSMIKAGVSPKTTLPTEEEKEIRTIDIHILKSLEKLLPWIYEQIGKSPKGYIILRIADLKKEMGPDFVSMGNVKLYWMLIRQLFDLGIVTSLEEFKDGEKAITMRTRNETDTHPSLPLEKDETEEIILGAEYLSEHDVEVAKHIEDCLINIWGYPAGSYEWIATIEGEILYQGKKEKEKEFDNREIELYFEWIFVHLSDMAYIGEYIEPGTIETMKEGTIFHYAHPFRPYPYTEHDLERLKMIFKCVTDIWEKEKDSVESRLFKDYIEYIILDIDRMIKGFSLRL